MQKFENPRSQTNAEVLSCPWSGHSNRARGNHQEESSLQSLYWAKSWRGWQGRPWRICTSFFRGSGDRQTPPHQTQHYCSGGGPRAALRATDHAGVTDLRSSCCSHTHQDIHSPSAAESSGTTQPNYKDVKQGPLWFKLLIENYWVVSFKCLYYLLQRFLSVPQKSMLILNFIQNSNLHYQILNYQ